MNSRVPQIIRGQYEKINSTYFKNDISIKFDPSRGWVWQTKSGPIGVLLTHVTQIFEHPVDCEFEFYSGITSEFFTSSILAVENNSDLRQGSKTENFPFLS